MSGRGPQDQTRAERLAAELRANLKKRKARSRALKATPTEANVAAESDPDASEAK